MDKLYDMIVIGGGPGGYTAALYAARAGLSVLVLERLSAGGQISAAGQVDNYPGFDEGIDGFELGERMQRGAERFGAVTEYAEAAGVELKAEPKLISTTNGDFAARTVVAASGASPREMGLPGERGLVGRGVAYCATCEGAFYRDKTVAVYGGGNSAAGDALTLAKLCKKVYVIHRRDTLTASKSYHEPLKNAGNIEFVFNTQIEGLKSGERLEGLSLKNTVTGERSELECDGVFVAIGRVPETGLFKGQLDMDASGYIKADETTRTGIPGVFAVGDVRTKALRQAVTAASDGAMAAFFAERYLAGRA